MIQSLKQHRLSYITAVCIIAAAFFLMFPAAAAEETEPAYAPDRILVKYSPQPCLLMASSDNNADREQYVEEILSEYTLVPGLQVIQLRDGITVEEALTYFWNQPDVEYAEPDYCTNISLIPNDPLYNRYNSTAHPPFLWNLNNKGGFNFDDWGGQGYVSYNAIAGADAKLECAWNYTTGSSDIVVAVLDTGVNYSHVDIAGNIWTNASGKHGYDFVNNDDDPMDDEGHGTHCAGTIGAVGNNGIGITGAAWDVSIMAVKVINSTGAGFDSQIISGIQYAVNNHANIISLSLGGFGFKQSLYNAISEARDAGVLVVVAAGNEYSDIDSVIVSPAVFSNSLDNVITVGAIRPDDNKASFSNYGRNNVTVTAPGLDILSLNYTGGYVSYSGTSMATPLVAGISALMLSANESLTPAQIRTILNDTSDDISALHEISTSNGRVNATAAIRAAVPAGCEYREVSTYKELKDAITAANVYPDKHYTIVVKDDISLSAKLPRLSGNITLMPDEDQNRNIIFNESGRQFYVNSGTLTLKNNGTGELTMQGYSDNTESLVMIDPNGTFNMEGGKITGNNATYGGGVYNRGIFSLSNGEITDNSARMGGSVFNVGTFEVSGGTITANNAKYGGGVYNFDGGTFVMNVGDISDNNGSVRGGGVYNHWGTFIMSGGEISGCSSDSGGGVYNDGTFTRIGGIISNNTASAGGGVYNDDALNMTGGDISYNDADYGGGVYNFDKLEMSGGEITGNNAPYGGGIYNEKVFNISGSANISSDNELWVEKSNFINLVGELSDGGGAYNITAVVSNYNSTSRNWEYIINPICSVVVCGSGSIPDLDKFKIRWFTNRSLVLYNENITISGVTDVSLDNGTAVVQTLNITTYENIFNESVAGQTKSGYTFLGWGTADKIVIDANGNLIPNVMEFTNTTGYWVYAYDNLTLSAVWESNQHSGGGSTDTGSGNYKEYDRSVTDGGHVSFGTSPTVTSVDLPKGVSGSVVLVAESKTPAPEGKETVTVFEINILNYPSGKESEVQFKLTVAEIEKAGHRPADICLYHCDSKGVWTKLPTTYSVKDGVVYYEALTTEFSPFAIVYEEDGAAEIKQPAVKETETQKALPQPTYTEPTITATPKAEQAKSTIGLIGLIAGLGCYLVALRRK